MNSKLKDFADDIFKFHENERKLSKQVENTVGKREIARDKQFLLFPQCFQKACFPGASKGVIAWEWVKTAIAIALQWSVRISLLFPIQALVFTCLQNKSLENTVVKGEIAHNEQFLHLPQCFLPLLRPFLLFFIKFEDVIFKRFSCLEESKI